MSSLETKRSDWTAAYAGLTQQLRSSSSSISSPASHEGKRGGGSVEAEASKVQKNVRVPTHAAAKLEKGDDGKLRVKVRASTGQSRSSVAAAQRLSVSSTSAASASPHSLSLTGSPAVSAPRPQPTRDGSAARALSHSLSLTSPESSVVRLGPIPQQNASPESAWDAFCKTLLEIPSMAMGAADAGGNSDQMLEKIKSALAFMKPLFLRSLRVGGGDPEKAYSDFIDSVGWLMELAVNLSPIEIPQELLEEEADLEQSQPLIDLVGALDRLSPGSSLRGIIEEHGRTSSLSVVTLTRSQREATEVIRSLILKSKRNTGSFQIKYGSVSKIVSRVFSSVLSSQLQTKEFNLNIGKLPSVEMVAGFVCAVFCKAMKRSHEQFTPIGIRFESHHRAVVKKRETTNTESLESMVAIRLLCLSQEIKGMFGNRRLLASASGVCIVARRFVKDAKTGLELARMLGDGYLEARYPNIRIFLSGSFEVGRDFANFFKPVLAPLLGLKYLGIRQCITLSFPMVVAKILRAPSLEGQELIRKKLQITDLQSNEGAIFERGWVAFRGKLESMAAIQLLFILVKLKEVAASRGLLASAKGVCDVAKKFMEDATTGLELARMLGDDYLKANHPNVRKFLKGSLGVARDFANFAKPVLAPLLGAKLLGIRKSITLSLTTVGAKILRAIPGSLEENYEMACEMQDLIRKKLKITDLQSKKINPAQILSSVNWRNVSDLFELLKPFVLQSYQNRDPDAAFKSLMGFFIEGLKISDRDQNDPKLREVLASGPAFMDRYNKWAITHFRSEGVEGLVMHSFASIKRAFLKGHDAVYNPESSFSLLPSAF